MNLFGNHDVVTIDSWQCPVESGPLLLTMPNIPAPLHGLNPRTLMGDEEWDEQRFACYSRASYQCEICQAKCERMQAHELYAYNYVTFTAVFKRLIAVCDRCHRAIHSGRLTTMTKDGDVSPEYFLEVAEHCFKLIHDYNLECGTNFRLYDSFLCALRNPEIHDKLAELINKYDIKFYRTPNPKKREWDKWRLVWGSKIIHSHYASHDEWAKQMAIQKQNDYMRNRVLAPAQLTS